MNWRNYSHRWKCLQEPKRDKDAILCYYSNMVPEALSAPSPEERHQGAAQGAQTRCYRELLQELGDHRRPDPEGRTDGNGVKVAPGSPVEATEERR